MDTQNTPVHLKLWHRSFWLLTISNMFITMAVYMQIPLLPHRLENLGATPWQSAVGVGVFGLGMFVLGPFCSRWIEIYRRHHVCRNAMLGFALTFLLMYLFEQNFRTWGLGVWVFMCLRLVLGTLYGLVEMVLTSTLIVDKCESFLRTEANHSSAWFSRLTLALGPLSAHMLIKHFPLVNPYLAGSLLSAAAVALLLSVHFPFRSPGDEVKVVSTDRFFLPSGKWLFLNLWLVTCALGMLLSVVTRPLFYSFMMVGFFVAIISEKYVFANADLKSEAVAGLMSVFVAVLLLLTRHNGVVGMLAPAFTGFGVGILGSRFLLFFLKLSGHCQRGTSHSTFVLGWDSGLFFGLAMGIGCFQQAPRPTLVASMVLVLVAFGLYHWFVHPWYLQHKNR